MPHSFAFFAKGWEPESQSMKVCACEYAGQITKEDVPLLASEVIHRHRILEQRIITCHHGDSAIGDEVALPVGLRIVADGRALGNVYVTINDCLADSTMPA